MIKRIFHAVIDLQLWKFKLGGKRALKYLGSERWVCPLKHSIKIYDNFHSTFDLIQLFSHGFEHPIFIRRGLPSSFRGGFAATWTVVFIIIPITSYQRSVASLRMSSVLGTFSLLEFCILLHQLLDIGCPSLDLLSHHSRVRRRWSSESVHVSRLTLLVEIWWLVGENCNSIVPHKRRQTDEVENCSSSICFLAR